MTQCLRPSWWSVDATFWGETVSYSRTARKARKARKKYRPITSNWLSASSTSSRVTYMYMCMYHNQQREIPQPEVKFDLLIDPLFDQFMFAA